MNKKIIGLAVVSLVLIVAGAGIWWWENREIKGSPDDYIIKETPEGKIVENKKAGLTVKAPEGWEIEKIKDDEGAVNFSSPEMEVERKEGRIVLPLKKGCSIQSTIVYEKMGLEQIKEEARYTHLMLGVKSDEFEEITINNLPALKNTFDTKKTGQGLGIYIPKTDKGYAFYLDWAPDEKERCVQEFNKFLGTISIR